MNDRPILELRQAAWDYEFRARMGMLGPCDCQRPGYNPKTPLYCRHCLRPWKWVLEHDEPVNKHEIDDYMDKIFKMTDEEFEKFRKQEEDGLARLDTQE
jgi:hypothetical protein